MSETKKYRIRAALAFLLAEKQDSLSIRQLSILLACRKGPQTVRGLANLFGISKPAITRGADRLQEEGMLLRQPDATDKRSVNLVLTSTGAAFASHFE